MQAGAIRIAHTCRNKNYEYYFRDLNHLLLEIRRLQLVEAFQNLCGCDSVDCRSIF